MENKIINLLKSYRCQYSLDYDENSRALVDVLSPFETIKEGEMELELLAEHISMGLEKKE